MLVKINLLPAYYLERRKVRLACVVVGLVLAAEIAGLIFFQSHLQGQYTKVSEQVTAKTTEVNNLTKQRNDAKALTDSISGRQGLLSFINGIGAFNEIRPVLYERTANYTYRKVMVLGMNASNTQFTMDLYVTDLMDLAAFFRYIHSHPDLTNPTISAIPAYTERVQRDRERRQQQSNLSDLPNSAGGLGGFAGGPGGMGGGNGPGGFGMAGADGYQGMMGGGDMMAGAGMMGGPGMMGGAGMMGGNGPGGAMDEAGMGMAGDTGMIGGMGYPGMRGGGMMGGMAGMGGGGQGGSGDIPGLNVNWLPPGFAPRGLRITLTAGLRVPITRPEYGTSASQIGSSGSGGGGGGGMIGGGAMAGMGSSMSMMGGGMGGNGPVAGGLSGMGGGPGMGANGPG